MREQLADLPAPNDAVLETREIEGQIVIDADGRVVANDSRFTVDLTTLTSDRSQRDRFIRSNTLETSRFPTAEFQPEELRGFPSPPPSSGTLRGELLGPLTIHGTERPVAFELDGRIDGNTVVGTAKTEFTITEWGMRLPRVAIVLSVEDSVRIEVEFTARAS